MNKLFLYHYYESENGPFKNLSALPYIESQKVLDNLRQEGAVFASKRSDEYLKLRRELEERARNVFMSKGGRPIKFYPHYMTYGKCDWLKQWYKNGEELKIDINEFDPKTVSFTYGDLFPTMRYMDGKSYRGMIYTKDEIMKLIEKYGWPQEWNKDGNNGPERYIEVQIWDDKVISNYL
ncbi:hypothetical protein SAMN05444162_2139 [Paenibacillaceae bacterium GAS479]|nr:hypothetical protein SAMN05444162_2139 [Paenibacillaceae bacterium GAS479]